MKLSIKELTTVFTSFRGETDSTVFIENAYTDSREKIKKGLFIPIVGENFDGHHFLKDAIQNGAIATLWQEGVEVPRFVPTNFPVFFVKDTVKGLHDFAKYYLKKVNPKVIGITGSNGKTTTKDYVYSVVSQRYRTHKTKGNFNNHIGLPLTVLNMSDNTEVLILEMGMNHFGEISILSKLAEPDYSIITNIGESHIEYLGSREGISKAKLEIKDGLKPDGKLIIDGDEPLLDQKVGRENVIRCGIQAGNDIQLSFIMANDHGLKFKINDEPDFFDLPMIGNHNAKNASYAIAVGRELGVLEKEIKDGLKNIKMTGMRLEKFEGINGSLLINDAYNSSPTSMKAAIETLKSLHGYEKKIAVLGNMNELGETEEELHRSVASTLSEPITDVFTIGEKASWIADELKKMTSQINIKVYFEKGEALKELEKVLSPETVVLFKASRSAKFESLVQQLRLDRE